MRILLFISVFTALLLWLTHGNWQFVLLFYGMVVGLAALVMFGLWAIKGKDDV